MKRIFVSNCEGPIFKNNNALDLTAHFVPEGDRIYDIANKYDYVHANFPKRKDYVLGNTPKLVLPFMLAFDASNKSVEEFCSENAVLMPGSKETLSYLKGVAPSFLVSMSYEHCIRALCREVGFPLENTYCMKANIDEIELSPKEKAKLKSLAWEIGGMPPITITATAKSLRDLSPRDQETIKRLDKIFWNEVTGTRSKRILSDVNLSSATEKAGAVHNILLSASALPEEVFYVGSDYTDVEAMRLVREAGGLAVSFNGDESAVRNAEVSVISTDNAPICILADLFIRFGKAEAVDAAGNFDKDALWRGNADPAQLDRLFLLHPDSWPNVCVVSEWNVGKTIAECSEFKKTGQMRAKQGED